MTRYWRRCCGRFVARESWLMVGGAICFAMSQTFAFSTYSAVAQITPDATLPNNSSVKLEGNTFNITGGTQAGSNLFHSFREFSIPTGGTAFFNNAADIQNIISRVTGGSVSNIDGLIRANGSANLFLINPSGIVFGRNASLNIGGSFLASTASSLNFADGTQFSATAPQTKPLLTISVPIGLQYGQNPGSILNEAVSLQVQPGKTLALVGGDVTLNDSYLTPKEEDIGRIELGSVGSTSLVSLTPTEQGWALGYDGVQNFQDIQLFSSFVSGNNIQVRGRQIRLNGGSIGSTSLKSRTNLVVTASELVEVSNSDLAARDLTITTGRLIVRDGAQIATSTSGTEDAGDLTVRASDSVKLSGGGRILAQTEPYSTGAGGNLTIETSRLEGTQLAVRSFGKGPVGKLTVITSEPLANFSQIVPDNTLPTSSTVRSDFNTSFIEGGTQVGSNLFHSFAEFSVPTLNTAYFNNALDIKNIIARVTGSSPSNIDGFIRANGTANLFLINPNGIIFGKDASLNVGGSFVATTANAIQFGNQGFFSATNPNNPNLLSINPSAFLFNQIATAQIENHSVALGVRDGRSLLLVGGDIQMDGGKLNAFGGRVELGGVSEAGTVGLNIDSNSLSLNFSDAFERASVSLGDESRVDVRADSGGSIAIHARNIDISGRSGLLAGIADSLGSRAAVAGDITLDATETVKINNSLISNYVEEQAVGNGGNITVKGKTLEMSNGAQLITGTLGRGDAGSVSIQAFDSVSLTGEQTAIYSSVAYSDTSAFGNSGGIKLQARSLSLTNGAKFIASTFSHGDAGNIFVRVDDSVSIEGNSLFLNPPTPGVSTPLNVVIVRYFLPSPAIPFLYQTEKNISSGIFSTVELGAKGNAGEIDIQARLLRLTQGAQVQSLTRGEGKAGNIRVNSNFVHLSGVAPSTYSPYLSTYLGGFSSGLITSAEEGARGQGGNIELTADTLRLSDGAVLSARTRSHFRGGDVNINANNLEITSGAQIVTSAYSSGQAGNINVNTTDVNISGSDPTYKTRLERSNEAIVDNDGSDSGLFASVRGKATANAGNIAVNSRIIRLDNQGTIKTGTTLGEGGDITLNVRDILLLRNNSSITATAGTAGQGGNGGNITINAPSGFIVAVPKENSDITANAYTGIGGNVTINASGVFGTQFREEETPKSDITASSQFGVNGTVEINTPGIDPNSGLINLPTVPVDTKVASGCTAGASQNQSRFVVTGRGGLPLNPREAFNNNDTVRVDWVTLKESTDNRDRPLGGSQRQHRQTVTKPTIPTPAPIVEATGWVTNAKGEIILTADPPTATPHSSWLRPTTCGAPKSAVEH
ncbi:filamentous hemagglutinin N-terminal domain-containing protein [Tolypothrix sp. VBCCA 56010]|uniref:two-partner secretion domain-containing protein n=1 Tax=Tolypothrix sp. VBCCA 56010 TaxID=3137731 RepID=UPI003D7D4AE5